MNGMNSSDDKSQLEKFKEAARDIECDDDEARFAERLGKLVKPQRSNSQPSGADSAIKRTK